MAENDDAKRTALVNEVTKAEGIKFKLCGSEYELPRPLPVSMWVKLYADMDQSDMAKAMTDTRWFYLNFASKIDDAICELTGLKPDELLKMNPQEYDRVVDALAEQIGEELVDARPFSPNQKARRILLSAGKVARGMARTASAGGKPASSPNTKSAGATGTP